MKIKFKIAFFLGLGLYLYILTNFSYVSVYYTYVALPTLAMLGLFGFGSFKSSKSTAQMIFWFTLIIWIVTLFFCFIYRCLFVVHCSSNFIDKWTCVFDFK